MWDKNLGIKSDCFLELHHIGYMGRTTLLLLLGKQWHLGAILQPNGRFVEQPSGSKGSMYHGLGPRVQGSGQQCHLEMVLLSTTHQSRKQYRQVRPLYWRIPRAYPMFCVRVIVGVVPGVSIVMTYAFFCASLSS